MCKDHDFMSIAAKTAETANSFRSRHGAIIVQKGYPISIATNINRTHPLAAKFAYKEDAIYLHAELHAILRAARESNVDFSKCTLYVARMKYTDCSKRHMIWGNSKPCPGCASAIAFYNIPRVVYSLDGPGENFEIVE